MNGKWWCRVEAIDFGRDQTMELARVDDGGVTIVQPATFKREDHGYAALSMPFLRDRNQPNGKSEMFQAIMDELWKRGYRASEGLPPGGEIHRMEEHIGDLRKVAFKLLKVAP